ncbi:MAG: hypothetical protein ABI651_11965, partial [Verrucomicrobiota bacterium]
QSTADDVRSVLAGKILIDVTVPLKPPKVSVVQLPPEGSAVLALQKFLARHRSIERTMLGTLTAKSKLEGQRSVL